MQHDVDRYRWDCPLDPIVITTHAIASGNSPILIVRHDVLNHGGWQLYDGTNVTNQKAMAIPKTDALNLDPSLKHVVDLPAGWEARRNSVDDPWERRPLR